MALAKAVVTGTVYRAPEKRFTQNNIPVSSFVLNIGDRRNVVAYNFKKNSVRWSCISYL